MFFLTPWYPFEENRVFGIYIKEQAKAIAKYNDVLACHLRFKKGKPSFGNCIHILPNSVEEGFQVIRIECKSLPIPMFGFLVGLRGLHLTIKKLKKAGWYPDIIHANIYSIAPLALLLGKIHRVPVIFTEHCSDWPRRLISPLKKFIYVESINKMKAVISVSQFLQGAMKAYGIKNHIYIVPNVVDTQLFRPRLERKPQESERPKKILLVALLSPVKGVPYLLDALWIVKQRRRDFVLDIIGNGEQKKEYEMIVHKLSLSEFVNFHSLKSKEEVAWFMREADFLVLPSLVETFGVVLIEAMASGLPVIATNVGAVPELIDESKGILVPPKNSLAMAKAIDYMLDHYKDYSPLEIASYAQQNFSYEVVGARINEIYEEILRDG
ncbi:MAG: glycosyltransferase [bacterium]